MLWKTCSTTDRCTPKESIICLTQNEVGCVFRRNRSERSPFSSSSPPLFLFFPLAHSFLFLSVQAIEISSAGVDAELLMT